MWAAGTGKGPYLRVAGHVEVLAHGGGVVQHLGQLRVVLHHLPKAGHERIKRTEKQNVKTGTRKTDDKRAKRAAENRPKKR